MARLAIGRYEHGFDPSCLIIFSLPFVGAIYLFWKRVKYQFISGCVNPAKILSVSPPLLAVSTDLTKGGTDCPVIKVIQQPLSKMTGGPPKAGMRVATVSFYEDMYDELDHWSDFHPKMAACVSNDLKALNRMRDSIEDEEWEELETGIQQLPTPLHGGILRRVYSLEDVRREFTKSQDDMVSIVNYILDDVKYVELAASGIRPATLQKLGYVPPQLVDQILAVVESAKTSSDATEGFTMLPAGVYYNFSETGTGSFAWADLTGAFLCNGTLEIGLKDGSRIAVPFSHMLMQTRAALEMLFNAACEDED